MAKPPKKSPRPVARPEPSVGGFHPRTDAQRKALAALETCQLVFLVGPAGTGKTMLAAWYACKRLLDKTAAQVIVSRPPVEAGPSIGALPGPVDEKMDPYIRPIFKAMAHFLTREKVQELRYKKVIEVVAPTFLRGETYTNAVMIFDEMQNATPDQLRLALTRAGENTTMIITMDPSQIDLPGHVASSYDDVRLFLNRPNMAVIEFEGGDVVRSEIVRAVIAAYMGE